MESSEITRQRLLNQHVAKPRLRTAAEIVFELGAVQAQDFGMGKWAIGTRLRGATERAVHAAIESGEVVRMHLLRPTWHFVHRKDVRWMLDLTAPNIRASMSYRDRQLGLTDETVRKSTRIIEKALKAGPVTRDGLVSALAAAGIPNEDNRAAHLLMRAELDKVACSAPVLDGGLAHVLFDAWIPPAPRVPKDEALATLASRYFSTRCPATVQDFSWWSGLPLTDARRALEMLGPGFTVEATGRRILVHRVPPRRSRADAADGRSVALLPAFDELVLSYADRSALFAPGDTLQRVVAGGVIKPIVVAGARVIGTWSRRADGQKVAITVTIARFGRSVPAGRAAIEEAAELHATFLGRPLDLHVQTDGRRSTGS